MPRSNRPRRAGRPLPRGDGPAPEADLTRALGGQQLEHDADGSWWVRRLPGGSATGRTYRCPGCQQEVPSGTPHVVVWSADDLLGADSALSARRHWHNPCWRARARRRPT